MRAAFVTKLNENENIFKNSDAFDRLFLKTIIKCGNENETQNNKTLCEHLDCKYNENKEIKCQHDIENPKRFNSYEERYQVDMLKNK